MTMYTEKREMKYREYGCRDNDTILLLHGGGLSWWNFREEAQLLQESFHVLLPILDGHAGSDRPYTSIEDNAEEIVSFIDEHCKGKVLLLGGLSLGAQTALEILSRRKDICQYALIESAALIPDKLTNVLVGPAFGSSYGLIRNRSFAKLQFASLHMKEELFEDYYRDSCAILKEDMIAFLKANTAYTLKDTVKESEVKITVVIGEKETKTIRSSAELLRQELPDSRLVILPGLYHGEFSLNHAQEYVQMIREIIGKGNDHV